MPRYYFTIINGIEVPDRTGLILPDESRAKRYAEDVAARLNSPTRVAGLKIKVTDEDGRQLFEVHA